MRTVAEALVEIKKDKTELPVNTGYTTDERPVFKVMIGKIFTQCTAQFPKM